MTDLLLRPACMRHRAGLLGLVDPAERAPATDAALTHLGRCVRCEADLTELALTIHALRRAGAAAAVAEPGDGAWTRLMARIERSRGRAREAAWRWRLTLGGLVTGTLLVAVLVGPLAIQVRLGSAGVAEPTGYSAGEQTRIAEGIESSFQITSRSGTLPPDRSRSSASSDAWRNHPDGIRPLRKEVEAPRLNGAPPEAS